jgi:hypothetical protein
MLTRAPSARSGDEAENVVTRFEANLLTILQFLLGRGAAELAVPLIATPARKPAGLSRTAVRLVQDTLAKGTTLRLAHAGGWRRERHLRGEAAVTGRLWERTPPAELGWTFGRAVLDFLLWLTACDPKALKEYPWQPDLGRLTLGDQLVLFLAYAALREEGAHRDLELSSRPAFARHGLCRLAYPEDFGSLTSQEPFDLLPWTEGAGSVILEAWQSELAERWREIERSKEEIADFARMRTLGAAQERVLTAFLDAVEKANRLDLARFLLVTAEKVVPPSASASHWVGGLQPVAGQRLADRAETYEAATALLRQLPRLKLWERRARATGYFDEGYAAAQLWLADWEEHHGDAVEARARAILKQLDPMTLSEGHHESSLPHQGA